MKKSAGTQFTEEELEAENARPPHSHLSEVDEAQMLRARIDEQSALIMILKQRADDAVAKTNAIEHANEEQAALLLSFQSRLDEENKKCFMLETRFFELASNHEEMIKIKDEYKASNERLRTENIQLRRDNEQLFSKQLNLLTEECESMRRYNEAMTREAKSLEQQNRKLEALLKEATETREREKQEMSKQSSEKINSLMEELRLFKDRAKSLNIEAEELKSRLASMERQHSAEKEKLTKEKDELLALVMERGRIIQDKQTENKSLHLQTLDLQRQVSAAKQRFQEECDRVDVDTKVQRLRDQLSRLQSRYDSLAKAHEAFKRHTGQQLDSERQLNNQLATYNTYTAAAQFQPIVNTQAKLQGTLPGINVSYLAPLLSNGLTVNSSYVKK